MRNEEGVKTQIPKERMEVASSVPYSRLIDAEPDQEAGSLMTTTPSTPSAPPTTSPSQTFPRRYPNFDELESKVLTELKELKSLLQQRPTIMTEKQKPVMPQVFLQAVSQSKWKDAVEMIQSGQVPVITKQALRYIFHQQIAFTVDIGPERLKLWKLVLNTTKVTADNLAKVKSNGKAITNALQSLLIHGDEEIVQWIKANASDDVLRKGVDSNIGGYSLVAWMADYCLVNALKRCWELKYSSGSRVFPATPDSDWSWSNFSKEVKRRKTKEEQKLCFMFWGEHIAVHL